MKKIFKFALFIAVVAGMVWVINIFQDKYSQKQKQTPTTIASPTTTQDISNQIPDFEKAKVAKKEIQTKTGAKEQTFAWKYKEQEYSMTITLYKSIYEFYVNQPKVYTYTGQIPQGWEDDYYAIFLEQARNDNTIEEITKKFRQMQAANNLSDNETVELAVAFVQTIFYDSARAKEIVQGDSGLKPRYPYEVLYDKKAVCSGKSFLLVSILRDLGYGAALLEYEAQNHMAAGIECPKQFSVDNSGYCYIETTTFGHKIGVVPKLDTESNVAVATQEEISHFEEAKANDQQENLIKPTGARIFQKTQGKSYSGVERIMELFHELDQLEQEIPRLKDRLYAQKRKIDKMQQELNDLEAELNKYKGKDDNKYNKIVPEYNKLVNKIKAEIDQYNNQVIEYNNKVDHHNMVVEELK
ncbi:MAG: hypothetical protein GF332_01970 [Candidatus Moranbacteria bacterium]|nr:hypothetical protein [Candidatus Moranbacteria bacterium]